MSVDVLSFDDVMRAARAWYYGAIRELVDDAIGELKRSAGPDDDQESARAWLTEWLHESIDGHEFVIYTAKASMALAASDNENAMADEVGTDDASTVEQRCYYAMHADAWQLLDAREDEWAVWPSDEDS